MYGIDNDLQAQIHYKQLLQEAERERQALQARGVEQRSLQHSAVYMIGSALILWGQRLERFGTSHAANS
jgi:cell division septal protein FtsQ